MRTLSTTCVIVTTAVAAVSPAMAESCISNASCPPGHFCAKLVGDCYGIGQCMERPIMCFTVYDPVCGCDGETYGNACEAARAGVSVAYSGECRAAPCTDNDDCDASGYCAKAEGDCAGTGNCVERPQDCPETLDPVCGCDGKTYDNPCSAAAAGVNIAHRGQCHGASSCTDNSNCGAGYYCARPPGQCDAPGQCRERPTLCPEIWDPVCGCDGKTYGNACEAAAAGVNVAYEGPCLPPGPRIVMLDPNVAGDDVHTGASGLASLRILWSEPVVFEPGDIGISDQRGRAVPFAATGSNTTITSITFGRKLAFDTYRVTIADSAHSGRTGLPIDGDGNGAAGGQAVVVMQHRMRQDLDDNNCIDFADLALLAQAWLMQL